MARESRPLESEADWWAVRELLIETVGSTPPGWNWDIRRWDGWRFHRERPLSPAELGRLVRLWFDDHGRLVAAVHPEAHGDAFLEVDPSSRALEATLVPWAEEHLAAIDPVGDRTLELSVQDDDQARHAVVRSRGYVQARDGAWLRSIDLSTARIADAPPPHGYAVRPTRRDDGDAARMARLLNRGFGRTTHSPAEYRAFMDGSPSFRDDLNLVAVAADGSFAAHAGYTLDTHNRLAILEPVVSDPDHRRLGLARCLILEGLARVRALGAARADLETGEGEAANALYAECGFTTARHVSTWRRRLPGA